MELMHPMKCISLSMNATFVSSFSLPLQFPFHYMTFQETHTGVQAFCTRVCMIGVCVSHNTFLFMRAVSLFFEQMPSCAVVPVQGDSPAGKNDCLENTVLVAIFP